VIVLVWTLYVVVKPIHGNLALLAVLFRLAENCLAAVATLSPFAALSFVTGADTLRAFDPGQLQALACTVRRGQGMGLGVAFVFLGVGSAIFSFLWFRSRYVPRALAAAGEGPAAAIQFGHSFAGPRVVGFLSFLHDRLARSAEVA